MSAPESADVEPTSVDPSPRLISYAQNFEDVMLWRALGDIAGGTYIDVGAAWPVNDSVTMLFYERGWSGLNVEPNPALHRLLCEERERDVNVCVAAGSAPGEAELNVVTDTGLSTLDGDLAGGHESAGHAIETITIEVRTLTDLWDTHLGSGHPVHFLKIDVEGFELQVIQGNDWSTHRPWVLLVEATLPSSQVMAHHEWEPVLVDASYRFVYADGLNRFYVADEHADLASLFAYPPNIFDGFVSHAQAEAEAEALRSATESRRAAWMLSVASEDHDRHAFRLQQAEAWGSSLERSVLDARKELATLNEELVAQRKAAHLEAVAARIAIDAASSTAAAAVASLDLREQQLAAALHAEDALRRQVAAMEASSSWKITAPIRWTSGLVASPIVTARTAVRHAARITVRPLLRVTVDATTPMIRDNQRLRTFANTVLARVPRLRSRLLSVIRQRGLVPNTDPESATATSGASAMSATSVRYLELFQEANTNKAATNGRESEQRVT